MLAVEFGSGRRGDGDPTSDRDLLIIGRDWSQVSAETLRRSAGGYSVSAFLSDKAAYLMKTGSLFFKHICDEGVLVEGHEDAFRDLIRAWQPARDYCDEVRENLDLLEVIRFAPPSPAGLVATVDILISSVRNILIRRLAGRGLYVFAWGRVLEEACLREMIKRDDIGLFMFARRLKNIYRLGHLPNVHPLFVEALVEAAGRACGSSLALRFASRKVLSGLPDRFPDRSYKQLRAIELMCAGYEFETGLASLITRVRRPSYFRANGI